MSKMQKIQNFDVRQMFSFYRLVAACSFIFLLIENVNLFLYLCYFTINTIIEVSNNPIMIYDTTARYRINITLLYKKCRMQNDNLFEQ